jgi:hypothetical protein
METMGAVAKRSRWRMNPMKKVKDNMIPGRYPALGLDEKGFLPIIRDSYTLYSFPGAIHESLLSHHIILSDEG